MGTLNVDIGGAKSYNKIPPAIRVQWKVLDIRPVDHLVDYVHDLNSGEPFPFKKREVNNYYSSMAVESIHPGNLQFVFNEMWRTLVNDGKIRIVVPDITIGMKLYLEDPEKLIKRRKTYPHSGPGCPPTPLGHLLGWFYSPDRVRNDVLVHGHKMVFDWETLNYYVEEAGFENIHKLGYNSCSPVFSTKDFGRYARYGLYLEATKTKIRRVKNE